MKYIKAAIVIMCLLLVVSILFDFAAGVLSLLIKITILAAEVALTVNTIKNKRAALHGLLFFFIRDIMTFYNRRNPQT